MTMRFEDKVTKSIGEVDGMLLPPVRQALAARDAMVNAGATRARMFGENMCVLAEWGVR